MGGNGRTLDAAALAAFRDGFRGDLVLPEDAGYEAARLVWNGLVDRRPTAVARCTGVADVLAAIRFAREQDLLVAVRSGGHSVGGFSTCDGGIVIDVSPMRGVHVDPQARIARVNGGTLLGELDREAQAFGLACPVGVVGHTGVAGLTLGGGMGRLQRKHGFTVDNLLSVDLVTADGRLVRAGAEENAELFWGVRGAGPNFGVVTSFEFKLHPVGPMVTQGMLVYPIDRAREIAGRFHEIAASAPDELFLSLAFGVVGPEDPWPDLVGQPVVIVGAMDSGPVAGAARNLAPLRADGPVGGSFDPKPYLAVQASGDESFAWGKRFYMKGGYTDLLTEQVVDVAVAQVEAAPGECSVGFWAQGGAVARVPPDAMAFTGREAAFWVGVEAFWEDPARDDEHIGWGRAAYEALTPFTTAGHYVNDIVETGGDMARRIYGDAKFERLVALKREYDPDNVFQLNQNIRP
jgi:FAD/FMN-containing dehydrogenase